MGTLDPSDESPPRLEGPQPVLLRGTRARQSPGCRTCCTPSGGADRAVTPRTQKLKSHGHPQPNQLPQLMNLNLTVSPFALPALG